MDDLILFGEDLLLNDSSLDFQALIIDNLELMNSKFDTIIILLYLILSISLVFIITLVIYSTLKKFFY